MSTHIPPQYITRQSVRLCVRTREARSSPAVGDGVSPRCVAVQPMLSTAALDGVDTLDRLVAVESTERDPQLTEVCF